MPDVSVEIILFNDLHLADKPPALRKEGYFEEGLAMLCELVEAARMENACLVTSGDLFHLKPPLKNSLTMLGQVIDAIRPIGRLFVVPGNHDLNTRGNLEGQPLELLAKAGVVQLLTRGRWELNGIQVISRPYNMERDTDPTYYALESFDGVQPDKPVLMVAHGSIVPNGAIRPYPHLKAQQIDTTGIDMLACGHIHEDLGHSVIRSDPFATFINRGSLGRVARTASNLTRQVFATGLSTNSEGGLNIEDITIKSALPGHSIFNEEKLPEAGANQTEIEVFVQGLTKGMQMEQIDLTTLIKSLGLSPTIEARMLHYLEEAGLA